MNYLIRKIINSYLAFYFSIFKIFFSFYSFFREDLDPPPVGFCCFFVFSPCSRSSGLSWSFSSSFGHVCLLDSFICLFLVSEASIRFDFRFLLFFPIEILDEIPKSILMLRHIKGPSILDFLVSTDSLCSCGPAQLIAFHLLNSGGEL